MLHGGQIDLERVREMIRQFAEILVEPRRVAEFEELVRRQREPSAGS